MATDQQQMPDQVAAPAADVAGALQLDQLVDEIPAGIEAAVIDQQQDAGPGYSSGEGRLAMIGVDTEAVLVRTSLRAQVAAADEPDHDFTGT